MVVFPDANHNVGKDQIIKISNPKFSLVPLFVLLVRIALLPSYYEPLPHRHPIFNFSHHLSHSPLINHLTSSLLRYQLLVVCLPSLLVSTSLPINHSHAGEIFLLLSFQSFSPTRLFCFTNPLSR